MEKINSSRVFFFFILFVASGVAIAQTYGTVLGKDEADRLFGAVLESSTLNESDLVGIINQSSNVLMFNILKGELVILGNKRNVLYPMNKIVDTNTVFHVFSKSKILELLGMNASNPVVIERRQNCLTVTYGLYTLEFSVLCPPWCP